MLKRVTNAARGLLALPARARDRDDELRLLLGGTISELVSSKESYETLKDLEFKVFSQFGDDGIIQYLTSNLNLEHKTFIEFGVEDYLESNTRFLLQKDNWSGFVMDASEANISRLRGSSFFWKYDLNAKAAFVSVENINELIFEATSYWPGVDLLHIDIDGNDYWIWDKIEIFPSIVIVEYNSTFGIDRPITIPYDPAFYRTKAHYSNLYWGASLKALHDLASHRGYEFIGCNSAGNNAYFVRKDLINDRVRPVSLEHGFVLSKYRESRNQQGELTYASVHQRMEVIKGLPVFDIDRDAVVEF
jgi:hypothetical protein